MSEQPCAESGDRTIRLSDGRQLGYAEYGDPDGIPAFYFHGLPGSRLCAELNAADATAAGVRLISPDRPGMGLSDFRPRRRLIDWPVDVIELADGLGIDRFAVLGVSGGGPYVLACAMAIPERVTMCGSICGMVPFEYVEAEGMKPTNVTIFRVARRMPWLLRPVFWLAAGRFSHDEAATCKLLRSASSEVPMQDRELMREDPIERIMATQAMEAYRQGSKGCAYDAKLYVRDWGFRLEDISCERVLLWHGEQDANLPVQAVRQAAEHIPGCRATFYPNEAHLSTVVRHGAEFMEAVRQAASAS